MQGWLLNLCGQPEQRQLRLWYLCSKILWYDIAMYHTSITYSRTVTHFAPPYSSLHTTSYILYQWYICWTLSLVIWEGNRLANI